MRVSERYNIVSMIEPADNQSGGIDSESINMGLLQSAALIYSAGAITGNDSVIILYSGASSGTKTTALLFKYRVSGADYKATNNDQFGDATAISVAATGLVMAAASYDHRVVIIEVDSQDMPDGEPWLTVDYDDGSASTLLSSMIAVCVPRYQRNDPPTIVA